jgi:hypothetical protein
MPTQTMPPPATMPPPPAARPMPMPQITPGQMAGARPAPTGPVPGAAMPAFSNQRQQVSGPRR